MGSPIFNAMNNGRSNNPMQMIEAFNRFKNGFNGNAKEEVQKLLNSGKMSQSQYNQLQNMASSFMKMIGK